MLNPSTADDVADDPTIRRCMGFSRTWGYGAMAVVNLFALRATSPTALRLHSDPIGPDNDVALAQLAGDKDVGLVVAAWGAHGSLFERGARVVEMLVRLGVELHCLGTTKAGQPRHPLYLRADARPEPMGATGSPGVLHEPV